MKNTILFLLFFILFGTISIAQEYGNFPKIEKQKLLNDLELLYQGLDKFHSGMYWYTPKETVDSAFAKVKSKIDRDMNVLEFHKLVAPLVSLSREGHTKLIRPSSVKTILNNEIKFLPLTVIFLDEKLFIGANGSKIDSLKGLEIELINGEKPIDISNKLSKLITSDGYNQSAKRYHLGGFSFSEKYFYWYGIVNQFKIKFRGIKKETVLSSLTVKEINKNLNRRYPPKENQPKKELLEYKILNDSTAYLGVHTFSQPKINERYGKNAFTSFLKNSFESIAEQNIQNLIIDVSKNGGGTEGYESLLYSYLGDNFKKYKKVRAKTNKAVLDNGVDEPITLEIFGPLERMFVNKKMKDGSFERKQWPGFGLEVYKKKPENSFSGKLYVIIGPETYSGGSEFANLIHSQNLATFVGQETGGGYYGNTSGYVKKLILPNSQLIIGVPALQFVMNVEPKLPFGSGVIPDYEVIPTFNQLIERRNIPLEFILKKIAEN